MESVQAVEAIIGVQALRPWSRWYQQTRIASRPPSTNSFSGERQVRPEDNYLSEQLQAGTPPARRRAVSLVGWCPPK